MTGRRAFLGVVLVAGSLAVAAGAQEQHVRRAFADKALAMRDLSIARGDQPYGAVVVKDGRVVGQGVSAVITDNDPTAHAEMQAIRDAARALGTRDLSGSDLYSSSRACTMCEAAAYWARIDRMYFGEMPADAGAPALR